MEIAIKRMTTCLECKFQKFTTFQISKTLFLGNPSYVKSSQHDKFL